MANSQRIQDLRKLYGGYSVEDLMRLKREKTSYSEEFIAAEQELHARQQISQEQSADEARRQHQESLSESRRTNRLAWIAIAIALLALAVSAIQLALTWARETPAPTTSVQSTPTRADGAAGRD